MFREGRSKAADVRSKRQMFVRKRPMLWKRAMLGYESGRCFSKIAWQVHAYKIKFMFRVNLKFIFLFHLIPRYTAR